MKCNEDYKTDALSDDLNKEALKELIPPSVEQCIKDGMMYRNVCEDTLSAAQFLSVINERSCSDVQNQIIRMEVDAEHDSEAPPAAEPPGRQAVDWADSLGYGPTQGGVGKSGAGSGNS